MADDIDQWLAELGLGRYAELFATNEIDLATVRFITDDDLRELGVALGPRRQIVAAAADLGADRPAESTSQSAASSGRDAERRQLTLMFCDLVGSTPLSQRIDPEDLRELMLRYQDAVSASVARYGGHVANYLGDGLLAYFGWPRAYEDQAERAVRAGLDAIEAVHRISFGDGEFLQSRVGIATGRVVVGDLVGELGKDTDAVSGKTPNLAARLEGVAATGDVVIDETTKRLIGHSFGLDDLGPQQLKGFTEPVRVWRVGAETSMASRFEARGLRINAVVGRDTERQLLIDRWQLARSGKGQLVSISGEAGIGKSRLVRLLRDHVANEAHHALRHQCSPYYMNSAFAPVIRRIGRDAELSPDDDDVSRRKKLEHHVAATGAVVDEVTPVLANLLGLPNFENDAGTELSARQMRERTLEVLVEHAAIQSQQKPMLFVVEDVHWVDPSTEAMLRTLSHHVANLAILVVVTHRPGAKPPWSSDPNHLAIGLNRLSRAQCAEIVRTMVGDAIGAATINDIVERADGMPLFVEELARAVVAGGNGGDFDSSLSVIPESLEDLLMERLDRLGEAREVAHVGSAIGRDFSLEIASAVTGMPDEELDLHLRQLVESGLLVEQTTVDQTRYVFRHALVQEAAHASMLLSRRRELHLDIAHALIDRLPDIIASQPELLASHFDQAAHYSEAVHYFEAAGRRASAASANTEAIAHFEAALDRLDQVVGWSDVERQRVEFRLRTALGVALIAVSGYASEVVRENYVRAHSLGANESAEVRFAISRGLWNCYFDRGDLERARVLADDLLALANSANDHLLLAFAHRAVGSVQLMAGDMESADAMFERGLAARRQARGAVDLLAFGEDPALTCGVYLSWTKTARGFIEEGRRHVEVAAETAEASEHPISIAFAETFRVVALGWSGDFDRARPYVERLEQYCRDEGIVFWAAAARMYRGWVIAHLGHADDGLVLMREGLAQWRGTGAGLHVPTFETVIAEGCLLAGKLPEARRALDNALRACELRGENLHLGTVIRLQATERSQAGDVAGAIELFELSMDHSERKGAALFRLRAALDGAHLLRSMERRQDALTLLSRGLMSVDATTDAAIIREATELQSALAADSAG